MSTVLQNPLQSPLSNPLWEAFPHPGNGAQSRKKMGRVLGPKAFQSQLTVNLTAPEARVYNQQVENDSWLLSEANAGAATQPKSQQMDSPSAMHATPSALTSPSPKNASSSCPKSSYIAARLRNLNMESAVAKVLRVVGLPCEAKVEGKDNSRIAASINSEWQHKDRAMGPLRFQLGAIGNRALQLAEQFITSRIEAHHTWKLGNVVRNAGKDPLAAVCVWRAAMEANIGLTYKDVRVFVGCRAKFTQWLARLRKVLHLNAFHRRKVLMATAQRVLQNMNVKLEQMEARRLKSLCTWLNDADIARSRALEPAVRCADPVAAFFDLLDAGKVADLKSTAHPANHGISLPVIAATAVYLVLRLRPTGRKRHQAHRGKLIYLKPQTARQYESVVAQAAGLQEASIIKCKKAIMECMRVCVL